MKNKICFVSLNSYPILTKQTVGNIGGAEVQQVLIAQELLKYGYDISFITYSYSGNLPDNTVGKIKIFQTYADNIKINPISKILIILQVIKQANADVYIYSAGCSGVLSLATCFLNKKFIFRIPSDNIINKMRLRKCSSIIENFFISFDIICAKKILVQSLFQKNQLLVNYRKCGTLIKNCIPIIDRKKGETIKNFVLLWVGSSHIRVVKQPLLLLKLSEYFPDVMFHMVGGIGEDADLNTKVLAHLKMALNIKYYGYVPYDQIDQCFERASVLVNTSLYEGFPNTFLQAWLHHVPVVSLNVDPDEIICENNLGFHSVTFEKMLEDIQFLIDNESVRQQMGNNGFEYVKREHNIEKIVNQYVQILDTISDSYMFDQEKV